jgi:hypothetical protein
VWSFCMSSSFKLPIISRQAFDKILGLKNWRSGVRDIPFFRPWRGAQNLKRIKQILSELYFPQLRQLRQVTWGLTSGLTWQLRCSVVFPVIYNTVST